MTDRTRVELAKAAYIFGYPLVYDITEVISQTTAPKVPYVGPVNLFGHATRLADFSDEFVSLNNDTLYSFAHCDVQDEPLVLHVPNTHDRYYVMQFVDPWTNNFAYVGRRATGTGEGNFLLAGPDWQGETPASLKRIDVPNGVFSIIGRYAVDGVEDVQNVALLQAETYVTPLSRFPEKPLTEGRTFGDRQIAPCNESVPEELLWWEKFRAWMRLFPAPAADLPFINTLAPLGVNGDESTYLNVDPTLVADLVEGAAQGQAFVDDLARKGSGTTPNGWILALHTFDYNLDRLGPGTIDSADWKFPNRQLAYAHRAGAARGGLWGNHGFEAAYALIFVDADGNALSGKHRYRLHFDQPPPVKAFWSVTMYDAEKNYLVENPIGRYSIGDRTPGIAFNANGSIDLVIQHKAPADTSNWLPAPDGPFRPILRMYQPGECILNGTFVLPAIEKIG